MMLAALLLLSSLLPAQQPGQLGAYQGQKAVGSHWMNVALFSDYTDAYLWYAGEDGARRVIDSRGMQILPQKADAHIGTKAHARAGRKEWTPAVMPDAVRSRTKIPGAGYVR